MDTHVGNGGGGSGLTADVRTGQVAGLGRNGPDASSFFNGPLDDIAVWNRALTVDEISFLASGNAVPHGLAITEVSVVDGMITIRWMGGQAPYQLQRRTSLSSGDWENVGSPTSEASATDTIAESIMFYRVTTGM